MGKDSGGGSATKTVTQKLDPQTQQRISETFGYAENIASQPFMPYQGQRYAPLNPIQTTAIQQGVASLLDTRPSNTLATAGQLVTGAVAGDAPSISQEQISNIGYEAPTINAPNDISTTFWSQQAAERYMNPYINEVIDTSLDDINRQLARTQRKTEGLATAQNAYGGTRMAVRKARNAANANELKAETIANLYQQGYTNAQNIFTSDYQRALQAKMSNQQAALQASIANQRAAARARQARLQARTNLMLANLEAEQTGVGQQLQAAGMLSNLAQQQISLPQQRAQAIYNLGMPLQQLAQNRRDFRYQQYRRLQQAPFQRVGLLSSALSGMPVGSTTTTSQPTYSNPLGSIAGGALTGGAIGGAISGSSFGPIGAVIGGGLGLLGSIL